MRQAMIKARRRWMADAYRAALMGGAGPMAARSASSWRELSEAAGVSVVTLRSWERGGTAPRTDALARLAALYGERAEDLLENE